ncbi:winged helix-turn-helix domain-containing protein [Streptomyces lavendulae]|uniref:winged helix-turn-helix domain-containing protein n=1 Tax=Streptomyces lavendulae TaxID=1914 RepID=UPI0024A47CA6|nr:helix-turn-helix domain-containing protein [Streptomyces lavendulae]GLW04291.1 hypothetical protein Slala05_79210 [Streptomyces lavendulae subsp. lavendulae]
MTMALAVAFSQPGRQHCQADFYEALVLRPTVGGAWARGLRARKGDRYTETKLGEMLDKARRFATDSPPMLNRADAALALHAIRQAVEAHPWRGRAGGMDEKNLVARLHLAERAGGAVHQASVRQLAELMGCARSTAEASNRRLVQQRWLQMLDAAGGRGSGSSWRLSIPEQAEDSSASPGQLPPAGERGAGSVPEMHNSPVRDSRALGRIMAHDAFHAYSHGTSGARVLACLDPMEGASVPALAAATGLHRTTVRRRLRELLDDHLVEEADDLYYLPRHLAGDAGLEPDEKQLGQVAHDRGTEGLGARRRQRHAAQREVYQRWLEERDRRSRENRRSDRPRLRLVPEGVLDATTGELVDQEWQGWDVSDPYHPIPRDDLHRTVVTEAEMACA